MKNKSGLAENGLLTLELEITMVMNKEGQKLWALKNRNKRVPIGTISVDTITHPDHEICGDFDFQSNAIEGSRYQAENHIMEILKNAINENSAFDEIK